jgi:hypothetical protein
MNTRRFDGLRQEEFRSESYRSASSNDQFHQRNPQNQYAADHTFVSHQSYHDDISSANRFQRNRSESPEIRRHYGHQDRARYTPSPARNYSPVQEVNYDQFHQASRSPNNYRFTDIDERNQYQSRSLDDPRQLHQSRPRSPQNQYQSSFSYRDYSDRYSPVQSRHQRERSPPYQYERDRFPSPDASQDNPDCQTERMNYGQFAPRASPPKNLQTDHSSERNHFDTRDPYGQNCSQDLYPGNYQTQQEYYNHDPQAPTFNNQRESNENLPSDHTDSDDNDQDSDGNNDEDESIPKKNLRPRTTKPDYVIKKDWKGERRDYYCQICDLVCFNYNKFRSHLKGKKHNSKTRNKCHFCDIGFKSKQLFKRHKIRCPHHIALREEQQKNEKK